MPFSLQCPGMHPHACVRTHPTHLLRLSSRKCCHWLFMSLEWIQVHVTSPRCYLHINPFSGIKVCVCEREREKKSSRSLLTQPINSWVPHVPNWPALTLFNFGSFIIKHLSFTSVITIWQSWIRKKYLFLYNLSLSSFSLIMSKKHLG